MNPEAYSQKAGEPAWLAYRRRQVGTFAIGDIFIFPTHRPGRDAKQDVRRSMNSKNVMSGVGGHNIRYQRRTRRVQVFIPKQIRKGVPGKISYQATGGSAPNINLLFVFVMTEWSMWASPGFQQSSVDKQNLPNGHTSLCSLRYIASSYLFHLRIRFEPRSKTDRRALFKLSQKNNSYQVVVYVAVPVDAWYSQSAYNLLM